MVVPDDQLSLAIGKEGQNARLAAKLTGYKIDIKPASAPIEDEETPADGTETEAEEQTQERSRRAAASSQLCFQRGGSDMLQESTHAPMRGLP